MGVESLTQEELKRYLRYEPESGLFVRLIATNNTAKVGDITGRPNADGYIKMTLSGATHVAHRLAFLWMTGRYPDHFEQVDHINGVRSDNRWSNLRLVTHQQNQHNRHWADSSEGRTSKHLGVSFKQKGRRRWEASIRVGRRLLYIGRFATEEEAAAAYLDAKRIHHPTSDMAGGARGAL